MSLKSEKAFHLNYIVVSFVNLMNHDAATIQNLAEKNTVVSLEIQIYLVQKYTIYIT